MQRYTLFQCVFDRIFEKYLKCKDFQRENINTHFLNIINYILIIICIVATYHFGIIALLSGYAVSSILRSLICMAVCGREIKYPVYAQLRDLVPVFIITLLTCLTVFFMTKIPNSEFMKLIISSLTGIVTFIVLNVVIKSQLISELKALKDKQ